MSKKNLFVSAALTTFVLVILTSVVAAYKQVSSSSAADLQPALPTASSIIEVLPTETQAVTLTHQEAALVAANFLGETDLFSVENSLWNELNAYKVVFSSGNIVYVSLDGQILSSEAPQPLFVSVPAPANSGGSSGQSQASSNNPQQEDHDDDDDHEENDDD